MIEPRRVAGRIARTLARGALASRGVRRVVESELARAERTHQPAPPSELGALIPATFTDAAGVAHPLDPRLRDRLKPNWRIMCDPEAMDAPPTDAALNERVAKAAAAATELERILALTTGTIVSGRILEIGCYDGSAAFELSKRPGVSIVASDLAGYYVVQRPGQLEADAIAAEEAKLERLRERTRLVAGRPEGSVTFVEDDIVTSSLPPESFDLIVSFEVLEHLQRPNDAFAAMARLLRPGGVMYHDYNPFFSLIGGHSLATLDFPWGHARLSAADVERYFREIRPMELVQAFRFYGESLNRMTQADLRAAVTAAGLEAIAIIPWYQRGLLGDATPEGLAEIQANYPTATLDDMLATFVAVVLRKPGEDTQR